MQDGSAQPPITSKAFLPIDEDDRGNNLVSYDLLHHGEVGSLLRALDFQALDDRGKVNRIAREVAKDYQDEAAAESLWRLSRALPVPEILAIIGDHLDIGRLHVRSKDGRWRPTSDVWLPNGLIPSNSIGDEHLLVDDLFHRQDLSLLKNLELRSTLTDPIAVKSGPSYELWKSAEAARISHESRNSPVPVSEASLRFDAALTTAGLHLLCKASIRTREKATQRILLNNQYKTKVEFSSTYKSAQRIDGPDMWWVRNYGVLQTPLDLVDVKYCAGAVEGIPFGFLPYPGPTHAEKLELPETAERINWAFALPLAERKLPLGRVHEMYGLLAKLGVRRPVELLVQQPDNTTTRYLSEFIVVAEDADTYKFLLSSGKAPAIYTGNPELTTELTERWKLQTVKVEFFSTLESAEDQELEAETISSLYPSLHLVESKIKRTTKCIPCVLLRTVRSNSYDEEQDLEDHETFREGSNFYYASTLSNRRLLTALLQDVGSSRRASDIEAELRRLAKVEHTHPEDEPDPEPEHLKTHAKGSIPLDASKDLNDQMKLIERAVLRYLDTPDANVFDLMLHFEANISQGITSEAADKISENVSKLGGQAKFEE